MHDGVAAGHAPARVLGRQLGRLARLEPRDDVRLARPQREQVELAGERAERFGERRVFGPAPIAEQLAPASSAEQ